MDKDQKKLWLEDYVRVRMTPKEFGLHIGICRSAVYAILRGRTWKDIPRPAGFEYPWPGKPKDLERDWKEECLRDYVDQKMTPVEFAEHVGCTLWHSYLILGGKAWTHVPRPQGFQYPWPERAHLGTRGFERKEREYRKVYERLSEDKKRDTKWTLTQLATSLDVSAHTARRIHRTFRRKSKPGTTNINASESNSTETLR
jgi:hypothetical protein